MKAYILRTRKRVDPFGGYATDCLIGNKKLSEIQAEAMGTMGIKCNFISDISEINDSKEHIFFNDNVYFTKELLLEFLNKSRKIGCNTVCSLRLGTTTTRTGIATQDVKIFFDYVQYGLCYMMGSSTKEEIPIIINPDRIIENISLPEHMCESGKYSIPITRKLIGHIDHWINLWSLNVAFALSNIARVQNSITRKFYLALKARSLNKWRVLEKSAKIGQGCDIHPTAYIEGSAIGDNVKIGAGAVIRSSIIDNNSSIGTNVVVEASVIGKNCAILHGHIMFSVFYSGVFSFTQMVSASIIGKDSFIGSGVVLTDFRFDGKNVSVIQDGKKVDTGNTLTGCCLGHEVYLGSGCIIAPGRMVPNKKRLVPRSELVIMDSNLAGFGNIQYGEKGK